jgi:hypothetical protein
MYIVEIVGPNGVRSYITVTASNSSEARTIANQMAEQGFFANISVPATESGIQQLRSDSPGFSNTFPSNQFTSESIISSLGAPVSGTGASPGTGTGGTGQPTTTTETNVPLNINFDPDVTPLQGNVQQPIATEEQSLFANFLRGLQDRGAGLSGVAGQARTARFRPLQAQFLAEQVLNPEVAGTPLSFAEFSRTAPLAGAQQGQRAVQLFNQALGMSRGLSPTGSGFDALTETQQGFLNPATAGQAQTLEDLARASARQRFGVASEFFRPNVGLFEQFQSQARPTALSFGEFLNQRIFGG